MVRETMKKAGLTSAFAAAAFAIVAATAAVSPAAAADSGSFSTRIQELNQHASGTDRSGYYAYAPYSYAQMAEMTGIPQAAPSSTGIDPFTNCGPNSSYYNACFPNQ